MSKEIPGSNEGNAHHIENADTYIIQGIETLIKKMSATMNSVGEKEWYESNADEMTDMTKVTTNAYKFGRLLGKNSKAKVLFIYDSESKEWSFTCDLSAENSVSEGGIKLKSPEYEVYSSFSEGFATYRTSQVEKYQETHGLHTEAEFSLLKEELSE